MSPETKLTGEAISTGEAIPLREFDVKRVPLSCLREDHSTQIRGEISSPHVQYLTAILNETETDLDAIDVFLEPGSGNPSPANPCWLADGFHRVAVYRGLQKPKIPARIHFGGKSEAIEWGLRKQGKHGLPMTSKQKRHAAEVAVRDARIGEFPDLKIARIIGVSPSLVNMVRRGIAPGPRGAASMPEPPEADGAAVIAGETEANGTKAPRKSRPSSASGKKESESTAPRSATVRERKSTESVNRPTRAALLKRIENELLTSCIEEEDLIDLMKSPLGRYVFLPRDGESITLKVVGSSGRTQVDVPVTVKEISFESITLKYTAGRLKED